MRYTSDFLRAKYLEFFATKQHSILPSASVVPYNDPSVLFNTAGMQPLVPYLMGQTHPMGTRLANSQKCIRTNDLDEVGDNTHHTFFEMLGNWSLGDYFKKESIEWSWEFLTSEKWLNIDPNMLAVTVFAGDENAPRDEFSASVWESVGMPKERISYLPAKHNWWAAGPTGPCGSDTEIFYWVGEGSPKAGSTVENDEHNWMEIWNNVFMEYNRTADGTLEKLPKQNVDTGMGLERITATLNGVKTSYDTDIFADVIETITKMAGATYEKGVKINETNFNENTPLLQTTKSIRIIADHSRTAVIMLSDGVRPSNVDQGYILRRIMRRAMREMHKLGYDGPFLAACAESVIQKLGAAYPNIVEQKETITEEMTREEQRFHQTLISGEKRFAKLIQEIQKNEPSRTQLTGAEAFDLYQTYGFPIEMIQEMAEESGFASKNDAVDVQGFGQAVRDHQEKSRAGAAEKFKGGLAGTGEAETHYHTATHLLLAALQTVLGKHVHQAGSNITAERLRFDFTHDEKMTPEQLTAVQKWVNDAIATDAAQKQSLVAKDEAKAQGVEGSFWERYPDMVTIYTFATSDGTVLSQELCGGPHAERLGLLGTFKIVKEEACSRGTRRIKAVLEKTEQ